MANRGQHHRVSSPPEKPARPTPTVPSAVIDPTVNVLSLVSAAIQRQDDLRDIELNRADDMRELTSKYEEKLAQVREKAQRDLAVAESRRIDAITLAESRRIDAVLGSMKADVTLANERASATAATLAATVSETRNTLDKRLAVVEQNQYQQGGAQSQRTEGAKASQWIITLIVGVVMAAIGIGVTITIAVAVFLLSRMWPIH